MDKDFSEIRLKTPFDRLGPNWSRLPPSAKLVHPADPVKDRFKSLLETQIPPGPSYIDLIREIWSRGFEVFVVGGTVRDVIAGNKTNDVDLVTTMPLLKINAFLQSMYRYNPSAASERGFIRIGGSPASGDPFIDLKVFSDSLTGTREATFGVDFERDVMHRDFACNALYYDPINEVLIDPTTLGIDDSLALNLTLICATGDRHQYAQIFIRAIKFAMRGFSIPTETLTRLREELVHCLPAMRNQVRVSYFKAQILHKTSSRDLYPSIVDGFRDVLLELGFIEAWETHFLPHRENILR